MESSRWTPQFIKSSIFYSAALFIRSWLVGVNSPNTRFLSLNISKFAINSLMATTWLQGPRFSALNGVWQSKPVALSEAAVRALAGSVVQTAPLFRTTELSSIYCLVKVSVRNYDISRAAEEQRGGGVSHFPVRPGLSDQHAEQPERWWIIHLSCSLSLKVNSRNKLSDLKGAFESAPDIVGSKRPADYKCCVARLWLSRLYCSKTTVTPFRERLQTVSREESGWRKDNCFTN